MVEYASLELNEDESLSPGNELQSSPNTRFGLFSMFPMAAIVSINLVVVLQSLLRQNLASTSSLLCVF